MKSFGGHVESWDMVHEYVWLLILTFLDQWALVSVASVRRQWARLIEQHFPSEKYKALVGMDDEALTDAFNAQYPFEIRYQPHIKTPIIFFLTH